MARFLIITGVLLILVGICWPWLQKLSFGRLPGDIFIEKEHYRFYLPVTTSLIISVLLSVILWFFRK